MQSSQHALAKHLFGEVCDLDIAQQLPRLHALTDDADIIGYVSLLLQQNQTDHPRVSQPILNLMSMVAGNEIKVGDTLGAWQLVAEIGQGGMGTVFRAQRNDGHFEQEAAVKLLHGIPSAKALEYLARERQILATLTHPNIARLYDGGATPQGQPYLVMEYVAGVAIDHYCQAQKQSTNHILKLMLEVCDAISFAHQRLIVHCDIKPSNILVTSTGRPMLLDFGIARLISTDVGADVTDQSQPFASPSLASSTLTQARAFTPKYASPEQRNGQALTTATDIYSLGKMLAELIEHSLATTTPNREIAAIVSRATQDDIAMRYATVASLANDLQRFLDRLPLAAVEAAPIYVARKFVQRNWPWLTAAGVFVFTVGLAAQRVVTERDRAQIAGQQAIKERDATQLAQSAALRERDRAAAAEVVAITERDRAKNAENSAIADKNRASQAETSSRQTSEFLVSVFESSNPNAVSGDISASTLIAAAESRLEKQMLGQPNVQANLYSALGRVQSNMGKPNEARTNYRRAIEIERKQNRPLELARVLTLEFQNDVLKLDNANMVALAREALALREQFAAPESDDIAESLSYMAYALRATSGDLKLAEKLLLRALAIRQKNNQQSMGMAETQHIAGQVYGVLGQHDKSIASYRKSIAIKEAKLGEGHPDVLQSLQYLAGGLNRTKQFTEAEIIFRRIVAQNEKLHGRQNVNMLRPLIYLGGLLIATGRPREALTLAEEALQIAEKTVGRDSTYAALALNNIGLARLDLGDSEGAVIRFREALVTMKKYMRPFDIAVATQEVNLGRALNRNGESVKSQAHLMLAYDIYRKVFGEGHSETLLAAAELMRALISIGKLEDAIRLQDKLNQMAVTADSNVNAEVAMTNALLLVVQGKDDDAMQALLAAERLSRSRYGEVDARTWLVKLPRTEWLAVRGRAGDKGESQLLAKQILSNVENRLYAEAPVLAKLRRLQQ